MYNWIELFIWPVTAIIVARTFLRAIGVIAVFLKEKDTNG